MTCNSQKSNRHVPSFFNDYTTTHARRTEELRLLRDSGTHVEVMLENEPIEGENNLYVIENNLYVDYPRSTTVFRKFHTKSHRSLIGAVSASRWSGNAYRVFSPGVPTRPTGKDAAVDRCPGVHYYVIISKRRVFRC